MGGSGDHRSPGLGIPIQMQLEILGPCNLPDEILSQVASPSFARCWRRPSHVNLPARRHIKIQKCGIDTSRTPLRRHILPNNISRLHIHLRADRAFNHVATSKTVTYLQILVLDRYRPSSSLSPTISHFQTHPTPTSLVDTTSYSPSSNLLPGLHPTSYNLYLSTITLCALPAPADGATTAAPEGCALAGPSAPTSTSTRWALVAP
jgi:hypothetical protein